MQNPQQIANAMSAVIQLMVDVPDEVRMEIIPKLGGSILKVSLAPTDIGKVIGKDGRTARSLRIILEAISKTTKQKFGLDIG